MLIEAIKGAKLDPWPDRALHNDLTILFRNGAQVEKFRDMARAANASKAPEIQYVEADDDGYQEEVLEARRLKREEVAAKREALAETADAG